MSCYKFAGQKWAPKPKNFKVFTGVSEPHERSTKAGKSWSRNNNNFQYKVGINKL